MEFEARFEAAKCFLMYEKLIRYAKSMSGNP